MKDLKEFLYMVGVVSLFALTGALFINMVFELVTYVGGVLGV